MEWGWLTRENDDTIFEITCAASYSTKLYPQKVAAADGHAVCDVQTETTSESHINFVQTLVLF